MIYLVPDYVVSKGEKKSRQTQQLGSKTKRNANQQHNQRTETNSEYDQKYH